MSQILRWVRHSDISRMEELLVHIYNLRMPTSAQLAVIMGLSKHDIVRRVYLLNKEQKKTVQSMKLRDVSTEKVYWLGRRGCQILEGTLGKKVEYYEFSRKKGQSRHNKGLNDILIRLIELGGLDEVKKYCAWWNTRGAKQELFQIWKQSEQWDLEKEKEEFKTMLSPDARLRVGDWMYWIEYDNDTKERAAIWEQFELYVTKLVPINNHDPVVWVCKDGRRRDEMKQWWDLYKENPPLSPELQEVVARKQGRGESMYLPKMHFFAAGEETKSLLTGRL